MIGADGQPRVFSSDRLQEISGTIISQMANNGLRTICIAYKDFIRKGAKEVDDAEVGDVSSF